MTNQCGILSPIKFIHNLRQIHEAINHVKYNVEIFYEMISSFTEQGIKQCG